MIKRKKFDRTAVLKISYNNKKERWEQAESRKNESPILQKSDIIPKKVDVQESIALARSNNFSLKLD